MTALPGRSLGELIDDSLTARTLEILPAHQAVEAARDAAKPGTDRNAKCCAAGNPGNPTTHSNVVGILCRAAAGRTAATTAIGLVSSSARAAVTFVVILVATAGLAEVLSCLFAQRRLAARGAATDRFTVGATAGFRPLGILLASFLFAATISRTSAGGTSNATSSTLFGLGSAACAAAFFAAALGAFRFVQSGLGSFASGNCATDTAGHRAAHKAGSTTAKRPDHIRASMLALLTHAVSQAAAVAKEHLPQQVSQRDHDIGHHDRVNVPAGVRHQQDEAEHQRLEGLDEEVCAELLEPGHRQLAFTLAQRHHSHKDGAQNDQEGYGQGAEHIEDIEVDYRTQVQQVGQDSAQPAAGRGQLAEPLLGCRTAQGIVEHPG